MSLAYIRFFIGDYRRDTRRLTAAERGAYTELLWEYYAHGSLPTDDEQLRKIADLTPKQWERSRPTLEAFFQQPGWKHKRVEIELRKATEKSRAAAENVSRRWTRTARVEKHHGANSQRFQRPADTGVERAYNGRNTDDMLTIKKEIEPSLNSVPRAIANFEVRRAAGFDPSAAIRAKLLEAAAGNVRGHATQDVAAISRLRTQGCSLELDILPVVTELVPSLPAPLDRWDQPWLLAAILNKREVRLAEVGKAFGGGEPTGDKPNGLDS